MCTSACCFAEGGYGRTSNMDDRYEPPAPPAPPLTPAPAAAATDRSSSYPSSRAPPPEDPSQPSQNEMEKRRVLLRLEAGTRLPPVITVLRAAQYFCPQVQLDDVRINNAKAVLAIDFPSIRDAQRAEEGLLRRAGELLRLNQADISSISRARATRYNPQKAREQEREREAAHQPHSHHHPRQQQQQERGYEGQRGPAPPAHHHGQPLPPPPGHPHHPPQPMDPRHRGVGVTPAPPATVVYQLPPGLAPPPGAGGASHGAHHGLLDPRARPGASGLNPLLGGPPPGLPPPGVNLVVTVQAAPSYSVGLPPGLMLPSLAAAPAGKEVKMLKGMMRGQDDKGIWWGEAWGWGSKGTVDGLSTDCLGVLYCNYA